jgi:hypothetical protein
MQGMGVGAGLAALGFWLMIAAAIIGGIWYDIRKKQAQHETLRRLIESGQTIDEKVIDKLLAAADGGGTQSRQEMKASLKLASTILFFVAPGLAILGIFIDQFMVMIGVAALVLCVGLALHKVAESWDEWYGEPEEDVTEQAGD